MIKGAKVVFIKSYRQNKQKISIKKIRRLNSSGFCSLLFVHVANI